MKILYVYLGSQLPKYVIANIKRNKKMFSEHEHILIVDKDKPAKIAAYAGLQTFLYQRSPIIDALLSSLSHDPKFRGGFWIHSFERLFSIITFAQNYPENAVLHLESDVLLMPNFPIDDFEKIQEISWLKFNDSHDVASILYLPKESDKKCFENKLMEKIKIHTHLTDMTALAALSQEQPKHINSLPIAMQRDSKLFLESVSEFLRDTLTFNQHNFSGIFDSAPFGMWLLGQDPRNHRGLLKKYVNLQESFIQPNSGKFSWRDENFLSFTVDGQTFPIYNLHVHSKEIKYFRNHWKKHLRKAVENSNDQKKATIFMPVIFLKAISSAIRRRFLNSI